MGYDKYDLVRITANNSLHGFEIGKVVAVYGRVDRRDGSHFYQVVDENRTMWGATDSEITLVEKYNAAEVIEL